MYNRHKKRLSPVVSSIGRAFAYDERRSRIRFWAVFRSSEYFLLSSLSSRLFSGLCYIISPVIPGQEYGAGE